MSDNQKYILSDGLTTDHPSSSYGQPVLVLHGIAYGPADCPIVLDDTDARYPDPELLEKWNAAVRHAQKTLGVGTLEWWRAFDEARMARGEARDVFGNLYITDSVFDADADGEHAKAEGSAE